MTEVLCVWQLNPEFGVFSAPLAQILKVSLTAGRSLTRSAVVQSVAVMAEKHFVPVSNTEAEVHVARSITQREITRLLRWCCDA